MRVFVAGGSGAIGRSLVPRLLSAGHQVAATTRSPDKARRLESLGATAVVGDALDGAAMSAAVTAFRPEAVMNQLTSLPEVFDLRRMGPYYRRTGRLRTEGTRILLEAAAAAGAARFVYQSIAFLYRYAGPNVLDEEAPAALDAPEPFATAVRETLEGERLATSAPGITGVVLRYGQLYGPGTYYSSDGYFGRRARARLLPVIGGGTGWFSFLHVDDAAGAAIAALERGEGVYNVVDDEPAPVREWLPVFCRAVGAPPPLRLPAWLARIAAGDAAVASMTAGRGASNARARRGLGWTPSRPSWRTGFAG